MVTLKKFVFLILLVLLGTAGSMAFAASAAEKVEKGGEPLTADSILERVEGAYASGAFAADFFQESPLEAIQIVDTAKGRAWFKIPGKLRWEYHEPDRIDYITDGDTLWVHTPGDSQVWTGPAARFFGEGSGALFLVDMKNARKVFNATRENSIPGFHRVKLVPQKEGTGISEVVLTISDVSYEISKISSINTNGEEIRIIFGPFDFGVTPDDAMFRFDIPENATVIPIE